MAAVVHIVFSLADSELICYQCTFVAQTRIAGCFKLWRVTVVVWRRTGGLRFILHASIVTMNLDYYDVLIFHINIIYEVCTSVSHYVTSDKFRLTFWHLGTFTSNASKLHSIVRVNLQQTNNCCRDFSSACHVRGCWRSSWS
jgi:hypothetical protein